MTPVEIWQGGVMINKLTENRGEHHGKINGEKVTVFSRANGGAIRSAKTGIDILQPGDSVTFETGEIAVATEK